MAGLDWSWKSRSRAGAPTKVEQSLRGSLKKQLTFLRKKIWTEPYKPVVRKVAQSSKSFHMPRERQ